MRKYLHQFFAKNSQTQTRTLLTPGVICANVYCSSAALMKAHDTDYSAIELTHVHYLLLRGLAELSDDISTGFPVKIKIPSKKLQINETKSGTSKHTRRDEDERKCSVRRHRSKCCKNVRRGRTATLIARDRVEFARRFIDPGSGLVECRYFGGGRGPVGRRAT